MERLQKLSWKARGTGAICTAEVRQPIRGFRVNQRNSSNNFATSVPEGSSPIVDWISFDGETYWVGLESAQGWPRTIRVTQPDVNGSRSRSQTEDGE